MNPQRSIILILAALLVAGCAGKTPLMQVYESRELFTATVNTLATARAAKLIDDVQYRRIDAVIKQTARDLDAAEAVAASMDTTDVLTFRERLAAANQSLDTLLIYRGMYGR